MMKTTIRESAVHVAASRAKRFAVASLSVMLGIVLWCWMTPPLFAQQRVFPGTDWEEATPESVFVDSAKLAAAVDYLRASSPFDGVKELTIIRNGRMIWRGTDIDKVHVTASVAKSFTSAVLGLLIDDGKATLDTRAKDYVPVLSANYPNVTLRHFATMTSGYRGLTSQPPWGWGQGLNVLTPDTPWFTPPGSEFFYQDPPMEQLSRALTHIAREPIEDLFRRRIAEPIGMNPSKWDWKDLRFYGLGLLDGFVHNLGSDGMYISSREAARYAHLFLNRGQWGGQQLISAAWVDEATKAQVPASTALHPMNPIPEGGSGIYGYNWWVNGTRTDGSRLLPGAPAGTYFAWGIGNSFIFAVPEWNMVVVRLGLDGASQGGFDMRTTTMGAFLNRLGSAGAMAVWDESGDGEWGETDPITRFPRWLNGQGEHAALYPDDQLVGAIVRTNKVNVVEKRSTRSVRIESGAVAISATGALTVADGVDIAAGAAVDVVGSLSATDLSTAGRATVAAGAVCAVRHLRVNEGGLLHASSGTTAEDLEVARGTLQLSNNAALSVSNVRVSGGTVNTGDGRLVVSQSVSINGTILRASGAAFQLSSQDLADPSAQGRIGLLGGTLNVNSKQKTVLLVSDSAPTGKDAPLVQLMESLGYAVDTSGMGGSYQASKEPFSDPAKVAALNAADLVLASRNTAESLYDRDRRQWNELAVPVVAMNGQLVYGGVSGRWGWTTNGAGAANRAKEEMVVAAGNEDHPFLSGLTSPVRVFDWTPTPGHQAPTSIYLPNANTAAAASHQLATFDGRPFLLDVPAGYNLDSGGTPFYGVTGGRRALVGHWSYGAAAYTYAFDSYITDNYRKLVGNVLGEMIQPDPLQMPNTELEVTADSVLQLHASGTAQFGDLRMTEGVSLQVSGVPVAVRDVIAGDGCSVQGDLRVSGTLSPGAGTVLLNILGNLTLDKDATYAWGLGDSAADLTAVTGELRLSATAWTLKLVDEAATGLGADPILFTYGSLADDSLGNWRIDTSGVGRWVFVEGGPSLLDDRANHRVLLTGVTAVPEPSTLALLGFGAVGLVGWGWRRWKVLRSSDP